MKDMKILQSFGCGKQISEVNGVKYIVSSRFQPLNPKTELVTLDDRIGKYLESELADLMHCQDGDIIDAERVLTAGKED